MARGHGTPKSGQAQGGMHGSVVGTWRAKREGLKDWEAGARRPAPGSQDLAGGAEQAGHPPSTACPAGHLCAGMQPPLLGGFLVPGLPTFPKAGPLLLPGAEERHSGPQQGRWDAPEGFLPPKMGLVPRLRARLAHWPASAGLIWARGGTHALQHTLLRHCSAGREINCSL